MKLVDSLLPKTELDPDWGYEDLRAFCAGNGLDARMSIEEAIEKING